ncbi:metallophosphoesterase family protein [Sinobaca sp. H24]|uniref:metallophosphoesterase family protein n=1 Tax=Sinobaca sp. H24 TaxID=2923376 RepID=UPI00207A5904|nr:metallophosphoesterase [Sinobaca sp. H24]
MKIVVLGDTHMPKKGARFPSRLIQEIENCDLIVHTGDIQEIAFLQELEHFAPVKAVVGNTDGEKERARLPEREIFTADGLTFGLVHGHGERLTTEKRAVAAFSDMETAPDCILFGHSHLPLLRYVNKTLLFNPGSVTDKRKLPYYSFGLLYVEKQEIRAEHVFYQDKS